MGTDYRTRLSLGSGSPFCCMQRSAFQLFTNYHRRCYALYQTTSHISNLAFSDRLRFHFCFNLNNRNNRGSILLLKKANKIEY
jgi:hypothetical protein